jgi:hypothetical protein
MAAPAYPEFHVTGPVHHYVQFPATSFGSASAPLYLGTAEVTPKAEERSEFEEVFNDIGGSKVGMQKTEQGEVVVIGVLLNRFSKGTLETLKSLGSAAPGFRPRASRGSLVYGRNSFKLWQVYENYFVPGYASTGLEIGYYYPQVVKLMANRERTGTADEKLMLVLECSPYWIPQANATTVSGDERAWLTYSSSDDTTTFPNAVRVPQ